MAGRDDERMLLRAEGRAQACDGILRSHFGRRHGTAGSEALQRLRLSEQKAGVIRQFWPRSFRLKIAAAAAVAVLVIVVLYALTGPGEQDRPKEDEAVVKTPEAVRKAPEVPRRPMAKPRSKKEVPEPDRARPEQPVPAPEREKPVVLAQISDLTGDVKVKRRDSEEWLGLEPGVLFSIMPGDTLTTDSTGQARLDLDGGDCLYVNSDAEIAIGEEDDVLLFKIDRGEIYLEKESVEGSIAIDTGFGRIHCPGGRFGLKMSGKDECLLQVLSGKVKCSEYSKGYQREYDGPMHVRLQRGKRCEEGTKLDSEDSIQWARKMRSKRRGSRSGWRHRPGHPGGTPHPGSGMPGRGGPRPAKGGMRGFFKKLIEQFDELDANGDGRLSIEESRLPEDFWNRLVEAFDADGDGELSAEECKAIPGKMKERRGPGGRGRDGPRGERGEPDDK